MRNRWITAVLLGLAALTMALPSSAAAAAGAPVSDWGSTTTWPWSGWWWPQLDSENPNLYDDGQALSKYDAYLKATTGTAGTAQAWEKANHFTSDEKNNWWGHCHAWSAAAILTKEPTASVTKNDITFTTDDQKGLLTELYYNPKLNWLSGTRSETAGDTTSDAFKDIAPAWMDYLLRLNVRYNKQSFIMDINADAQVWNFPVFAYSRTSYPYDGGWEWVRTTVWYSSPVLNASKTQYFSRTYTYWLKAGTLGQWYGNSVNDHPDFAWMPTGRNDMPHVSAQTVGEITGQTL